MKDDRKGASLIQSTCDIDWKGGEVVEHEFHGSADELGQNPVSDFLCDIFESYFIDEACKDYAWECGFDGQEET